MKKLVAVLPLFLLAGCALHKSHPCVVPPAPVVAQATPAEQPAVVPAPVVTETPTPVLEAAPAPAPVPAPVNYKALFESNMKDIFFDFDKSNIRADQQAALASDIAFLKANPGVLFEVVSSCDVVGGDTYNEALGQRRIETVSRALVAGGVNALQFSGATLGKTSSYCNQKNCQQLNRRAHFAFAGVR